MIDTEGTEQEFDLENTEVEDEIEGEEDDTEEGEEDDSIEIDGEKYTKAQLKESLSKSNDYTRKTQELAEERRRLEQQSNGHTPDDEKGLEFDIEEATDLILGEFAGQETYTERQLAKALAEQRQLTIEIVNAIKPMYEGHQQAEKQTKQMQTFADALGRQVTHAEIQDALKKSGGSELKAVALLTSSGPKREKPNMPGSKPVRSGQTPPRTPDEIAAAAAKKFGFD